MFLVTFFKLLLILPPSCFIPGFFLLRRRRFTAAEMICASIAVSLIVVYLCAWTIYLLKLNRSWCWGFGALWLVLACGCAADLRRFLCKPRVRHIVVGFGFILLVGLLFQSTAM